MKSIYNIEDLKELEEYLILQDIAVIRKQVYAEFLKYSHYKNAQEWNKAVRVCESLAIIGWGEHEPVQAVRGMFFNGNPETGFFNRFREPRFVDAIWSKRKNGYTMEEGRTIYHWSPDLPNKQTDLNYSTKEDIRDISLQSQRNWIPHNPVLITRGISNCYESTKVVIESIDKDLQKRLDHEMRPELYGNVIDRLIIICSYSYYDNDSCKTNHIIADESLKLKQKDFYPQLLKIYSKKEIEENGYYLRNRYEYGSFRNGQVKVSINFEKELSEMNSTEQKQKISYHIEEAVSVIVEKLKKKKITYNFDLMQQDFLKIITEWKES